MVKVYSTPTCPYCVALKQYLTDNNIDFEEVDVSQDEEALDHMVKKSGQMGVPVVEIDDEMVVGFNKEKINKLLKIEE